MLLIESKLLQKFVLCSNSCTRAKNRLYRNVELILVVMLYIMQVFNYGII